MTDVADRLTDATAKADENLQSKHRHYCNDRPFCATPYDKATRVKGTRLLEHNKNENHWPGGRTHYEIDRDQILFHPAFVRLARKTQVFIGQRNVVYRNRLMHTLEVVQLARSVAHKHCLNADLAEAIAYGHDIGHTPFGHAGEKALNLCLYEYFLRTYLNVNWRPSLGRFSGNEDSEHARFDNGLWFVIQRLAMKSGSSNPEELLSASLTQELLGKATFDKLIAQEILGRADSRVFLHEPLAWQGWDEGRRRLVEEFWVQPGFQEIFAHYVHGLRVLLCDKGKPWADLTRQTAYGIISHSWRKAYSSFAAKGFNLDLNLSFAKDETPEAFVVRQADDICFANSDINDALASKLWVWEDPKSLSEDKKKLICDLAGPECSPTKVPSTSRRLEYCEQHFAFTGPGVSGAAYSCEATIANVKRLIASELHPVLLPRGESANRIIRELFWFYCLGPNPDDKTKVRDVDSGAWNVFLKSSKEWPEDEVPSHERLVADYLASLTDDEAIGIHAALFSPEQAPWAEYFLDTS